MGALPHDSQQGHIQLVHHTLGFLVEVNREPTQLVNILVMLSDAQTIADCKLSDAHHLGQIQAAGMGALLQ